MEVHRVSTPRIQASFTKSGPMIINRSRSRGFVTARPLRPLSQPPPSSLESGRFDSRNAAKTHSGSVR